MNSARRPRVLVVEDDPLSAELTGDVLESRGYAVTLASDGAAAKEFVATTSPDLIVLDLGLAEDDGLVLCKALRDMTDAPIVVCSASTRRHDRVLALKLGADEFVARPYDVGDVADRVDALLCWRRRTPNGSHVSDGTGATWIVRVGDLVVDDIRRRVTVGGTPVALTPIEFRLLQVLAGRTDAVVGRGELACVVWGGRDALGGRRIDAAMQRLRTKLPRPTEASPRVTTVRGVGYGLMLEPDRR